MEKKRANFPLFVWREGRDAVLDFLNAHGVQHTARPSPGKRAGVDRSENLEKKPSRKRQASETCPLSSDGGWWQIIRPLLPSQHPCALVPTSRIASRSALRYVLVFMARVLMASAVSVIRSAVVFEWTGHRRSLVEL